jgi:uncharacterized protein (TIGR00290 family)
MTKHKVVFCWSGGKDSAMALHTIRQSTEFEVVSLLTTCNEHFQRVSMHGVRLELLERQAQAIGLPLEKVFVSQRSSNDEYLGKLSERLLACKARGVTHVAFGDIFLEDLRQWREEHLGKVGLKGLFPLWKIDSRELMREFFALGFGSVVCCVNDAYLDDSMLGRNLDAEFIKTLPAAVDPCGENGEFHSFAFAGPIFKQPVRFKVGEKIYRPVEQTHPGTGLSAPTAPSPGTRLCKGFWFCDLLPV